MAQQKLDVQKQFYRKMLGSNNIEKKKVNIKHF
jgi:hypothetical protein